MYTVSAKYYTTKVQGHMKKKILSGTIATLALATTLPFAPQASAYIGQEGEYLQWDKIDENGNLLYGSAWELTVKDSRFDEVDTYFIYDNHINPPKKFDSDGFLTDRDNTVGKLGVLVKGSQACLDMADCEITYELKEITPPQGYDLPKNNEPIVIKRTPYTPKWGDADMQWATLADDKLSFTVSPDENTKLGYYDLSMHTYYKPEDSIESFSTNDAGELIVRMVDNTEQNLGIISGDKEGSDHGVKRTFQDEHGQIMIETIDGKTHNLGFATGGGHAVWFRVVAPGNVDPNSDIPQVEQGKSATFEVTNQNELREGAIFSAPEVKTKIADTTIVSSPLEVRGAENLYEGMLISDDNQGGINVSSKKESLTFFKPVQVGKVVNTKTPPTTVEKVVTETPTPSTTTVTAPPETVTNTTTVTETPGVVTSTKEVTPEASTTTVTKTPEKETVTKTPEKETVTKTPEKEVVTETKKETVTKTPEKEVVTETKKEIVTKTPEKETVTETPEKETVTKTPEKEVVTTTVTPAPVTTMETETVTATPALVETTVTETATPDTPKPEVVYVTKTPPADMPEQARVPEEGDVLERPAKVLAHTGANTSLAALLLAGQAIAVGALVGFRNRKKGDKK